MKKVSDLTQDEIVPGLRIKSLRSDRLGTLIVTDIGDDDYTWGVFDPFEGDDWRVFGFYGNNCQCEVILPSDPRWRPLPTEALEEAYKFVTGIELATNDLMARVANGEIDRNLFFVTGKRIKT